MMLDSDSRQLDESDYRSRSTEGLQIWSSTIQILLPVAALAVIWGRRGLFTRFLLQFDKNCVSVICPSFADKQKLLQWVHKYLPTTWFYIKKSPVNKPDNFWKDGSLLCILVNSIIPGACPNPHRHYRHPPSHGQALAYKYLAIPPVFTDQDLTKDTLSTQQEQILSNYLEEIKKAAEKASKLELKYSSNYVAKGMGLVSGEENRKLYFYIYLNSNVLNANDIIINIRAPENVYETLNIPSQCIKRSAYRNLLGKKFTYQSHSQRLLLKPISDFSSLNLINQSKDLKRKIPITFIVEKEKVKVMYIPRHTGIYEVSIITNGCHLLGSPFPVSISENTSGIIEDLEESTSLPLVTIKKTIKRRVLSRVIDFLDYNFLNESLTSKQLNNVEDNVKISYQNDIKCNNVSSETIALTDTSPICEDHIEYEVTSYLESSLIPRRNPEKILESESESDESIISQIEITNNKIESKDEVQSGINLEKMDNEDENHNKFQSEFHFKEVDKVNNNELINKYEVFKKNEICISNSDLNILNYLPQLKYEKSRSCNELNQEDASVHNDSFFTSFKSVNNDADYCFQFKEKLTFWESQSNLKELKPKFKFLKQRRSLPNLFSEQDDTFYTQYTDDLFDLHEFKSKQKYWSFLSSQTINCIKNDSQYSLPSIFRKSNSKHNTKTKMHEYFDSTDYKNRFKECREFWQRVSSQDCLDDYLLFIPKSMDCVDSGFENNFSSSKIMTGSVSPFDLNTKAFDHSAFQERQNYWEKLTKGNENYIESDNKQYGSYCKKGNISESKKFFENKTTNYLKDTKYIFDEVIVKDDNRTNLTDDFKRMNGTREHMKIRFHQNKDFFKSLESGIR